ncbi:hypothetical protein KO494_03370 [Lacinutrix sp. C3R15]|uniref:DUF6090 family protein n=1 Tax=Flavobacteriaceae TaxID=49546 RepID=UPI001C09FBF4|nr:MULTISPECIES: DUF6090 family protein [Flavobacteriaceae]MBU2938572.1 hypothetical protein [Lacinutrix sp. C3R15]MDO6621886.1 DUF6090 family protein [Oceanihabitans sp. 1_MG-2023]
MKIFRKIRRTLLISGKAKSYMVYALGEIVLIVIGILIAWKINNLNEIRKNKIVEIKIYQSLNEELNSNLMLLDSSISRYTEDLEIINTTIKSIGLDEEDLTDKIKEGIIKLNYKPTQLHNGAINSVNSTNKFEFIESVILKDLIASYPNELDSFESQENKIENIIVNRLQPAIELHVSLIDLISKRGIDFKKAKSFTQQSNYLSLLNSREYQNALVDRLLQTEKQLLNSKVLKIKTETIAFKLNKELSNF